MEQLLAYTLEIGASDLHLIAGKPPIVRVDTRLMPVKDQHVLSTDDIRALTGVLMDEKQVERLETRRQVDFSASFKDNARFRVNVYYQKGTLAAAFRNIPYNIRTIEELNLPTKIKDFADHRQGLVLFVGPSGHGKSTTLAALVDLINHNRTEHIITIEDPIEYLFVPDKSIISQREVNQDAVDFATAIRASLREDANVLMVGEMRDLESIAAAVTVAETGHLVFATLHTNDAAQTVDRIVDVFPSHQQNQIRAQLSNILLGVVSQRLLPRVGGGRIPAAELMFANPAIKNLIRDNRSFEIPNVINTSAGEGMISLEKSLTTLVKNGLIKLEDALSYSVNRDLLQSLIRRF